MRRHRISAGQQLGRLTGIAIISGTVVLSGCSADPEPEQQASSELPPATATSAEPTPELPPLGPADFPVPEEARVQTEAGAEAFLRYYIDLINHQIAVPAGEPLRELGPDCTECLRIAQDLDQAAEANRRYQGSQITIDGQLGIAEIERGINLAFSVQVGSGALLEASGSAVPGTTAGPQELPSAAIVAWSGSKESWLVQALNFG